MTNGSGIGLGGGVTGVTGLGNTLVSFAASVSTLLLFASLSGCQSTIISTSPHATFESDAQVPVVISPDGQAPRQAAPATEWATIRLQADWNDLEAALEVAQTEAETAVVQELKGAVRASRAKGTPVPSLRRTFELLSISGETGLFIAEAELVNPREKSGGTHQMVLRAELHSAPGPNRERAAKFVEAMASRLGQLAGVDALPVR